MSRALAALAVLALVLAASTVGSALGTGSSQPAPASASTGTSSTGSGSAGEKAGETTTPTSQESQTTKVAPATTTTETVTTTTTETPLEQAEEKQDDPSYLEIKMKKLKTAYRQLRHAMGQAATHIRAAQRHEQAQSELERKVSELSSQAGTLSDQEDQNQKEAELANTRQMAEHQKTVETGPDVQEKELRNSAEETTKAAIADRKEDKALAKEETERRKETRAKGKVVVGKEKKKGLKRAWKKKFASAKDSENEAAHLEEKAARAKANEIDADAVAKANKAKQETSALEMHAEKQEVAELKDEERKFTEKERIAKQREAVARADETKDEGRAKIAAQTKKARGEAAENEQARAQKVEKEIKDLKEEVASKEAKKGVIYAQLGDDEKEAQQAEAETEQDKVREDEERTAAASAKRNMEQDRVNLADNEARLDKGEQQDTDSKQAVQKARHKLQGLEKREARWAAKKVKLDDEIKDAQETLKENSDEKITEDGKLARAVRAQKDAKTQYDELRKELNTDQQAETKAEGAVAKDVEDIHKNEQESEFADSKKKVDLNQAMTKLDMKKEDDDFTYTNAKSRVQRVVEKMNSAQAEYVDKNEKAHYAQGEMEHEREEVDKSTQVVSELSAKERTASERETQLEKEVAEQKDIILDNVRKLKRDEHRVRKLTKRQQGDLGNESAERHQMADANLESDKARQDKIDAELRRVAADKREAKDKGEIKALGTEITSTEASIKDDEQREKTLEEDAQSAKQGEERAAARENRYEKEAKDAAAKEQRFANEAAQDEQAVVELKDKAKKASTEEVIALDDQKRAKDAERQAQSEEDKYKHQYKLEKDEAKNAEELAGKAEKSVDKAEEKTRKADQGLNDARVEVAQLRQDKDGAAGEAKDQRDTKKKSKKKSKKLRNKAHDDRLSYDKAKGRERLAEQTGDKAVEAERNIEKKKGDIENEISILRHEAASASSKASAENALAKQWEEMVEAAKRKVAQLKLWVSSSGSKAETGKSSTPSGTSGPSKAAPPSGTATSSGSSKTAPPS